MEGGAFSMGFPHLTQPVDTLCTLSLGGSPFYFGGGAKSVHLFLGWSLAKWPCQVSFSRAFSWAPSPSLPPPSQEKNGKP